MPRWGKEKEGAVKGGWEQHVQGCGLRKSSMRVAHKAVRQGSQAKKLAFIVMAKGELQGPS